MSRRYGLATLWVAIGCLGVMVGTPALAGTIHTITIDGSDAIFLAGRTDLTIPAASDPWPGGMSRHWGPTPEEIQETLPPVIAVVAGDVVKVLDPASGGISFFNGFGAPLFGPDGNGVGGSNLSSYGGISGYRGPQGPLTGVFLGASIPISGAPATLDFSTGGLGKDFLALTPALGQVFYIGNGVTSGGLFQEFTAPAGATRLFLGIPDGFGFSGAPGAYDDNDGAYRIRVGVNETPTSIVPLPGAVWLGLVMLSGLAGTRVIRRRRRIE